MVSKVAAVLALVTLPFCVVMWHKSHHNPSQYRFDVTLYKSLEVKLKDGICGFDLLSMKTKVSGKSEFRASLSYPATADGRPIVFTSRKEGENRRTRLAFPFWLPFVMLCSMCITPVIRGPVLRWNRRRGGRCEYCGYNLSGNRSGRCSECGTRFR